MENREDSIICPTDAIDGNKFECRERDLKDLPYEKKRTFINVEYPGIVENDRKAIETLGGIEKISNIYKNSSRGLELQWRPDDIYSKPVLANRKTTSSLLLKVKRRWKKDNPEKKETTAEILGPIQTTYKYETIGDFQYLPMERRSDDTYRSLTELLFINEPIKLNEFISREAPMFLPPSSFSRVDKPSDMIFRLDVKHRSDHVDPSKTRPEHLIGISRLRRPTYGHFLPFNSTEIPRETTAEAKARMEKLVDPSIIQRVRKLFEDRPLWTRPAILTESHMTEDEAKQVLPAVAYFWTTGPWRKAWARLGYDPRTDPAAKHFQVIDVRIHANIKDVDITVKRQTRKAFLRTNKSPFVRGLGTNPSEFTEQTDSDKDINKYVFRPDVKPPHHQVYYQVYDIQLPAVQQLVAMNDGKETSCTEQDGWCLPDTTQQCRNLLKESVGALLERCKERHSQLHDQPTTSADNEWMDEGTSADESQTRDEDDDSDETDESCSESDNLE